MSLTAARARSQFPSEGDSNFAVDAQPGPALVVGLGCSISDLYNSPVPSPALAAKLKVQPMVVARRRAAGQQVRAALAVSSELLGADHVERYLRSHEILPPDVRAARERTATSDIDRSQLE